MYLIGDDVEFFYYHNQKEVNIKSQKEVQIGVNCRNMRIYLDYGNILHLLHTVFDFTEDPVYF